MNPLCQVLIDYTDGCPAQFKNQFEAAMLQHELDNGDHNLTTIIHKYGEPGHSPVQRVDSIHSAIERLLEGDVLSPYHFSEKLEKYVSPKLGKFVVIRLEPDDFFDYSRYSSGLCLRGMFNFNSVRQVLV